MKKLDSCGKSPIKIQRDSATTPTQSLANMPRDGLKAGGVKLSGLPIFNPTCPDVTVQGRNPDEYRHQENHAEGNEYEDSIRRGKTTTKTVKQGSDRERGSLGELFDWVEVHCRHARSNPSPLKAGSRYPPMMGEVSAKHVGRSTGRICKKCGRNEVYQDIKTMDWCEQCIWEFVKDDSND